MEQKAIGKWARRSASGKNDWKICFEQGNRTGHAIVRQNGNQWDIVEPDGLNTDQVHMLILMATKHSPELISQLMTKGN